MTDFIELKEGHVYIDNRSDRRFQAALAAMQALTAEPNVYRWTPKSLAKDAVEYADALLAELDKETST